MAIGARLTVSLLSIHNVIDDSVNIFDNIHDYKMCAQYNCRNE